MTNKTKWRPVYGTEASIAATGHNEGWVYFASDSGKLYLDAEDKRIPLGGSGVSIYYADQAEVPQDADGNGFYIINQDAITEEGVHLREDDLLINVDGAFYKIFQVDDDTQTYICTRIAISGSGGGGGGGGGYQADLSVVIDSDTLTSSQTLIYGKDHYVAVTATSTTDPYVVLTFDFTGANGFSDSRTVRAESGEPARLNLNFLPINNSITMIVTATADNSTMTTPPFKRLTGLKVVEMGIRKVSEDEYIPAIDLTGSYRLNLHFEPIGPANSSFIETLHVYVDGVEDSNYSKQMGSDEFGRDRSVTIDNDKMSHGVHKIELSVSSTVSGNILESDKIAFEAAWVDPTADTPVIWFGNYPKTVVNYESATIPFMVYNPEDVQNQRKSSVVLFKNGQQISELEVAYSTSNWEYWDISAIYEVGNNYLAIQCGLASKSVDVFVTTEGSRDLGLSDEYSLMMNFTAAGRSSSELLSTRDKWVSTTRARTTEASLQNFNWANNGWISPAPDSADYKNGSYLSIANGAQLTIPMPTISLNSGRQRNYSFEVRFRVKNVQKYSTLVTTIPTYFYIDRSGVEHKASTDGLTLKEIEQLGYTVLFDDYGSPWMNDAKTIQETNITTGVICKWLNSNGEGFVIGTQEAFFQSPEKLVSVRYKEDEVINIGFVVSADDSLVYIYLNGILSGATTLPPLTSAAPSFSITSDLVFDSTYCDFDLYRVRIYESGLTMPQVIHNYLSDLHDIGKYDQNQLTLTTNPYVLSYEKLLAYNEEHPTEVTMPYMTWKIPASSKDAKGRETLPYYKGDKRKVNVKFVNTPLDAALDAGEIDEWYYYTHCPSFTAENVDIDVQGTSSQGYPRRNYKTKYKKAKKWKFSHGPLAGQLMTQDWYFYQSGVDKNNLPVYKAKDPATTDINILVPPIEKGENETDEEFAARTSQYEEAVKVKKAELKANSDQTLSSTFHMDNEDIGTNVFTMKIDYMESSGSYNTGFANLMGNLKHPLYMKHPLEDQGINADTMRTSVYGFPLLVFHEYDDPSQNPTDAGSTYEYIGRYNMNLDKSSNEYYGYTSGATNAATGKTIKKIAECWELSDNQGDWTSWRFPNAAARETGFGTTQAGYDDRLEMMQHFEYRYSAAADQIDAIGAKGKYDGTTTDENIIAEIGTTNAQKNHYVRQKYYNLERLFYWLDSTDLTLATLATPGDIVLYEPVLDPDTKDVTIQKTPVEYVEYNTQISYDGIDGATSTPAVGGGFITRFTKDSKGYRTEKFRNEFDKHLDKHYCAIYFIMTELLLCYDSRGKNMMMSTWGPHRENGEYIWYPTFYDIDTQLGLNNSGAYLWDYDADVTQDRLFSSPGSVLWNNFYEVFYNDIVNTYRILRGLTVSGAEKISKSLSYENITGAYECNGEIFDSYAMRGLRPVIAIGLDEYYKYFATTSASGVGYFNTAGDLIKEGSPSYAYCCQGDKILNTELLLRNRLNYIDSWWQGGDYQVEQVKGAATWMRVNANRVTQSSDKYLDVNQETYDAGIANGTFSAGTLRGSYPVPYFDSRPGFKMKPFLKQYVFYLTDEVIGPNAKYNDTAEEQEGIWTPAIGEDSYKTSPDLINEQLNYIPGMNYLSSLGDLSIAYLSEFHFEQGLRVLDLLLGSDVPGYFNSLLTPDKFNLSDSIADSESNPAEGIVPKHKPLLQTVNMCNLPSLRTTLDFSASSKLKEFRALNTPITAVSFAKGAPLHTVHLPNTATALALIEATDLDRILTSRPVIGQLQGDLNNPDAGLTFIKNPAETYRGLYVEGVTDVNPDAYGTGHAMTNITIQGGKLKYNSYTLLKNLVNLKEGASTNNILKVNFTGLSWTPYTVVPYGEAKDGRVTYYKLTDHSTYEVYTGNDQTEWSNLTLNEQIYTYDPEAEMDTIVDLSLLDIFRRDYLNAAGVAMQQYTNTSSSNIKNVPTLTGHLYVYNTPETAIDEVRISKSPTGSYNPNDPTYGDLWPDLIIHARYVNEAYIAKYVQVLDSGKQTQLDINRYAKTVTHPTITSANFTKKAAKLNYDFVGWTTSFNILNPENSYSVNSDEVQSLIDQGVILDTPEKVSALVFDEEHDAYTLYAVFSITSYAIHFKDPKNETDLFVDRVNYGSYLSNPPILPTTDESALGANERYKFLGWVTSKSDSFPATAAKAKTVDVTKIVSQNNDRTFYACFIVEDATTTATDNAYFSFTPQVLINQDESTVDGYICSPATQDGSYISLSGKITIPATYNNKPVHTVNNGFSGQNITHVYFLGTNMTVFDRQAFQNCSSLKFVQIPSSLKRIGVSCFTNDRALEPPVLTNATGLEFIGDSAFGGALYVDSDQQLYIIPGTVSSIGRNAFAYLHMGGHRFQTIQFGTQDNPSVLSNTITAGTFAENDTVKFRKVILYGGVGITQANIYEWFRDTSIEVQIL